MNLPLVIRADGDTRMGSGHVMRCLALAQQWQSMGGTAEFVTACDSGYLRQRIHEEGFPLTPIPLPYPHPSDWESLSEVLRVRRKAWVVLDGYHFDAFYQSQIRQAGRRLLVIDDNAHLESYDADLLLNQNIHATDLPYRGKPDMEMLLGCRYALVRAEFLRKRDWERTIFPVARRILVTMGGSDVHNQSLKAVRALQQLKVNGLEAVVVMGPSNPHTASLASLAKESKFPVRLVHRAPDMAELMAWADLAISTASSTCWEAAFMGLPSVVLITAENQRRVGTTLAELGVVTHLGWHGNVSEITLAESILNLVSEPDRRARMSELGRRLVDGNGTKNVISAMNQRVEFESDPLGFRNAGPEDAKMLWQWANEPTVRANSFHSDSIPLDDHMKWYQAKLNSPDSRFWILEQFQIPVGQIRCDRVDPHTAEIAFSVAPEYRGLGLGTRALMMTKVAACRELAIDRLLGIVMNSNESSIRAFTKAGFRCREKKMIHGKPSSVFVWDCLQSQE